jgi:hypothetical protein
MVKMFRASIKTIILVFLIFIVSIILLSPQAFAVKKSKKAAMTPEDMEKLTTSVNRLVKKVYSASLFSPTDTDTLLDAKIKVDTEIQGESPDPAFADLVYKIAFILKEREYKDDAIDYYRTITDKFPDSPYVPKATESLRQLGFKMDAGAEESEE